MSFPWYTDIYIDASATGTGSGDTPANACVQVANNSLFTATGSAMIRAWVRRTHVETMTNSSNLGGNNMFDTTKNFRHWIIGWPSSGDPYYDERPAAGVSAGWDADNSTRAVKTTYGLNFPTFTTSQNGSSGVKIWAATLIANINFDNVASANIGLPGWSTVQSGCYLDNIAITNRDGPTSNLDLSAVTGRFGRLWCINTGGPGVTVTSLTVDEFVVHSLSFVSSGAIQNKNSGQLFMKQFVNYSNSVDFVLGMSNLAAARGNMVANYIERCVGVQPYSGYLGAVGPFPGNSTLFGFYRIDDYFRKGPMQGTGIFGPHVRLCSSAEAMYASNRATLSECSSWGGGFPAYGVNPEVTMPLRKYFDVISGNPITIFQPVYVSSTATFSLSNGTGLVWLRAIGCAAQHVTNSHMLVGTLANWAGSKLGGGVAWTIANTFTPTETGRVLYELSVPTIIQSAQLGTAAYALYGEPWAV